MYNIISSIILSLTSFFISVSGPHEFQTIDEVFYTESKNEFQKGRIYRPEGKGPFPGIIVIHGGSWASGRLEDFNTVSESLARQGYVVYSINYRLSPLHKHPAQILDLESALKYFKQHAGLYQLDVSRIALWGYSAGGHIASYYALTRANHPELKVQAVVAGGTPFDFTWYPHSPYIFKLLGGYRDEMLEAFYEASPVTHVSKSAPPFFMYHGLNDRLVEVVQSSRMQAELKRVGVEAHLHQVAFWGHMTAYLFSGESVEKGIEFLKPHLKPLP